MKYWIIGDEFLDSEDKKAADAQGYLKELICCKDCKKKERSVGGAETIQLSNPKYLMTTSVPMRRGKNDGQADVRKWPANRLPNLRL